MKKLLLLLGLALAIQPVFADRKKDKSEEKDKPTPREFIASLDWEKPEETDFEAVNHFYNQSDSLYHFIKSLDSTMVFYDVKMVANAETGDTIVAVVDEEGNIRNGKLAFAQYANATIAATNLTLYSAAVLASGTGLAGDLGSYISNPLKAVSTGKTLGKTMKKVKAMYGIVPVMANAFKTQKTRIRTYLKQADQVDDLSDPSLRNLPDVVLDESAVLTKSNEEIMESLNRVAEEDKAFMEDPENVDILDALNSDSDE